MPLQQKEKEVYSLILNSSDTTNLISTPSLKSYQYFINWETVIPKKYESKKFNVSFSFISNIQLSSSNSMNTGILSSNFGKTNTFDNKMTETAVLGYIQPIVYSKWADAPTNTIVGYYYYYLANNQDNAPTTINYPTNNFLTIRITDADPTLTFVVMQNYSIRFSFTLIE
jgi:hypothetical protein